MGKSISVRGAGGGGAGGGLKKVANEAARVALSPTLGDVVVQTDDGTWWYWDGLVWQLRSEHNPLLEITDSNSIDLTKVDAAAPYDGEGQTVSLKADLKLSAAAATAGYALATTDIQADGLRVQTAYTALRLALSATAPVVYDNTTGVISMPAATGSVDGYMTAAAYTQLQNVIASDATTASNLAAHIAQAVGAHAATAISVSPSGNISSTTVQAALVELQGDIDSLTSVSHVAVTLGAFGSTPNANGLSLATQTLTMQPASETQPGGVSTAAQVFGGEKRFPAGVKIGANTALAANVISAVESTTKASIPVPVMTTAQMNAIATPTEGMQVYNTTMSCQYFYNGSAWEPTRGALERATATVTNAATFTIGKARDQIIPIVGSTYGAAPSTIDHTAITVGAKVTLVGTSDTFPVTLSTIAGLNLNGTYTMGLNDTLVLEKSGTTLYEVSRSE